MATEIFMKTRCWSCGDVSDCVSNVKSEEPKPDNGDISFCFSCGTFAIFDDTFADKIRKPSPAEDREIMNNKDLISLKIHWIELVRRHKQ